MSTLVPASSPLHRAAREPGVVMLADCGRMDPGSPAEPMIRQADALLLISGTHSDELAHLAARLHELGQVAARPSLVLAGRGHPTKEVEQELGIPVMARIPYDPTAATSLTGHAIPGRARKGGLVRAAVEVARILAAGAPSIQASGPTVGQHVPGVPPQRVPAYGVRIAPELHNGHHNVALPDGEVSP